MYLESHSMYLCIYLLSFGIMIWGILHVTVLLLLCKIIFTHPPMVFSDKESICFAFPYIISIILLGEMSECVPSGV